MKVSCVRFTLYPQSGRDTLPDVRCKVVLKLDANSGFWQIPLSEQSRLLTTFVTPSGRYCFNKLPFGISSVPELFQKWMNHILEGLKGVLCLIDDVLIFGATKEEHNATLLAALKRLQNAGVTLNSAKCEFYKTSVRFLSHIIEFEPTRARQIQWYRWKHPNP